MAFLAAGSTGTVPDNGQAATFKYRPDIDGLRAVAVLPVCCFHAGLSIFPGGFIGVDIFFVISGYLMASLIDQDLSRDAFSLLNFYERRIRRIFPALFAMLIIVTAIASVLVTPKLFQDFGATLMATVFFTSNIAFAHRSANYFDAPTEFNPLLHTWSLAVEEQFYILFPIFLIIVWRFGRNLMFLVLAFGALASLALSIWGTENAPTATFYLLPTRVWELIVGALLRLWPGHPLDNIAKAANWPSTFAAVTGLILVVGSLVLFDSRMAFPGAAALAPCLGTALLIHTGWQGGNPVAQLLGVAPLRFVGKISYSLYLWHWPLLVLFDRYLSSGHPLAGQKILIVVLAGCIAFGSWRWVERPFRGPSAAFSRTSIYAAAAASMGGVALMGYFAEASNGWPQRFPGIETVSLSRQIEAESSREDQQHQGNTCFVQNPSTWDGEGCFFSSQSPSKTLLWGDSFATSYTRGFRANLPTDFDLLQYTSPACPPLFNYYAASNPQCGAFNIAVVDIIHRYKISTVIMGANWLSYLKRRKMRLEDIRDTVESLRQLGTKVVLIGQSPVFHFAYPDEYFYIAFGTAQDDHAYEAKLDGDPDLNRKISAITRADMFFDPMALLCHGDMCVFKKAGCYLFADYGHFTRTGSSQMVAALLMQMHEIKVR